MSAIVVTGSNGLIGSEVSSYFADKGWDVIGVDNNMRQSFFGPAGSTLWMRDRLLEKYPARYRHVDMDIRDRDGIAGLIKRIQPSLIVHCAAQPSHDLAATRAFDDFDINAVGTLNILEAARQGAPEAVICHMSTNKVYGDAPNELPLKELSTRFEYADVEDFTGVKETMRIDRSKHSLFGASKVAADVLVQEYGRYFGLRTCCLRGGCLTGPAHSGAELHGFLSYLVKVNLERGEYRVYGYKGKQVRDNIHSRDVARFIERFYEAPRPGEVYNIGGGRGNSVSILEAFERAQKLSGVEMRYRYVDQNREGDHICYISDLSKARAHYPGWDITIDLDEIFTQIVASWRERL